MVLPNNKGTNSSLELKDHVKYLDVMIGDKRSWKYHIYFIC